MNGGFDPFDELKTLANELASQPGRPSVAARANRYRSGALPDSVRDEFGVMIDRWMMTGFVATIHRLLNRRSQSTTSDYT